MSGFAFSLIAWLGPELATAILSAALVVALGFLAYGFTCLALWAGMGAYRALRCLRHEGHQRSSLPDEPGKPAAGGADLIR
jgi:hypothetical protein